MLSKLTTDTINNIFQALNFTAKHARVYIASLDKGESSAAVIAQMAGIPRSSCYSILNDLSQTGLMSVVRGETKMVFSPAPPEILKEKLEDLKQKLKKEAKQLQKDLPNLQNLHSSHQLNFPKVSFHQGEDGLKTLYYNSLSTDELLVICQGSPQTQTSLKDDPQYLKDFIAECAIRNLKTRELLEETPATREYQKRYSSPIQKIIITPPNPKTSFGHVDKHIYQGKIAYISHDNLIGIIIEDQTLFASEKAQFEILWQQRRTKKFNNPKLLN